MTDAITSFALIRIILIYIVRINCSIIATKTVLMLHSPRIIIQRLSCDSYKIINSTV